MINSKDLRIGNLIYAYKAKVISKIENIYGTSGLVDIVDNTGYRSHRMSLVLTIKPIELTEEILLKIGPEKEINNDCIKTYFLPNANGWKMAIRYHDTDGCYWLMNMFKKIDIQYVHSLQNLFYSLTGEELNIQL